MIKKMKTDLRKYGLDISFQENSDMIKEVVFLFRGVDMIVNFKIFGNEPIENVITCMHHKVDKQVCFGYHDPIKDRRKSTEEFLRNNCKVSKVEFIEMSHSNLKTILKTMRSEIKREISEGAKIFFDITGGESLLLVSWQVHN